MKPPTGLADELARAHASANWTPLEELYQQLGDAIRTATDRGASGAVLPEVIVGALAVRLGRVAASYSGAEAQFVADSQVIMSQFHRFPDDSDPFDHLYYDPRFRAIPDYTDANDRRRRPTPFESVVETGRRLRDLAEIRTVFQTSRTPTAGILGGSLSYGRFYNVRGGAPGAQGSDTDLLVIVRELADVAKVPGILKRVGFIRKRDVDAMAARTDDYLNFAKTTREATIFSHKVTCWADQTPDPIYPNPAAFAEYGISFHVVTQAAFDALLWHKRPGPGDDEKSIILDYRLTEPADGIARGFDGSETQFRHTVDKDGKNLVARFRVFDTEGGRFKPGQHQQLVLPNFEERWASLGFEISMPLIAFKWKLLERLRYERMRSPYKVLNLSLTHVRYSAFAPHVRRRTDALELEW